MRILLYHSIVSGSPADIHDVSASAFAAQMSWLKESGYRIVSLSDWLDERENGRSGRLAAITFDDGYQDNCTTALPILTKYCFPATIFLVAGLMGSCSCWRAGELAKAPLLTWSQAREMAGSGIQFGSHGLTHAELTTLDQKSITLELSHSQDRIEQELGEPASLFSYSYSRFNHSVRRQVEDAGYQAAFTYRPWYVGGPGHDRFELQRIGILANDTLETFKAKVTGSPGRRLLWLRRQLGIRWRRLTSTGRRA
jgi:peptidoglycan/xylan/chitin deacetylase (PgdA/CDA1 family)